jgi:hypothetical protein
MITDNRQKKTLTDYVVDTGKKILKTPFKIISYPLAGNLSYKVKNYLEDKLGKNWFDATKATTTTLYTNAYLYVGLPITYYIMQNRLNTAAIAGAMGLGYTLFEHHLRTSYTLNDHMNHASVPGKILSLFIEPFLSTKYSPSKPRNVNYQLHIFPVDKTRQYTPQNERGRKPVRKTKKPQKKSLPHSSEKTSIDSYFENDLETQLHIAAALENYELAAKIRDQLLNRNNSQNQISKNDPSGT